MSDDEEIFENDIPGTEPVKHWDEDGMWPHSHNGLAQPVPPKEEGPVPISDAEAKANSIEAKKLLKRLLGGGGGGSKKKVKSKQKSKPKSKSKSKSQKKRKR